MAEEGHKHQHKRSREMRNRLSFIDAPCFGTITTPFRECMRRTSQIPIQYQNAPHLVELQTLPWAYPRDHQTLHRRHPVERNYWRYHSINVRIPRESWYHWAEFSNVQSRPFLYSNDEKLEWERGSRVFVNRIQRTCKIVDRNSNLSSTV